MGVSRFDLHDFFVVGRQILQFNSASVRTDGAFMCAIPQGAEKKRKRAASKAKTNFQRGGAQLNGISIPLTRSLEEKPGAPLGFVDPNFDQARRGKVAMLVTNVVRLAQMRGQGPVVVSEFR